MTKVRLDTRVRWELAQQILLSLRGAFADCRADLRGSLACGTADPYSDIDVLWEVPDSDFQRAIERLPELLSQVQPIESIRTDPDFQKSDRRRLFFVSFEGVPLFWRADIDVSRPRPPRDRVRLVAGLAGVAAALLVGGVPGVIIGAACALLTTPPRLRQAASAHTPAGQLGTGAAAARHSTPGYCIAQGACQEEVSCRVGAAGATGPKRPSPGATKLSGAITFHARGLGGGDGGDNGATATWRQRRVSQDQGEGWTL